MLNTHGLSTDPLKVRESGGLSGALLLEFAVPGQFWFQWEGRAQGDVFLLLANLKKMARLSGEMCSASPCGLLH